MICSKCGGDTKVIDSRKNGVTVVRRRYCARCGKTFFTQEIMSDSSFFCEVAYRKGKAKHDKKTKNGC